MKWMKALILFLCFMGMFSFVNVASAEWIVVVSGNHSEDYEGDGEGDAWGACNPGDDSGSCVSMAYSSCDSTGSDGTVFQGWAWSNVKFTFYWVGEGNPTPATVVFYIESTGSVDVQGTLIPGGEDPFYSSAVLTSCNAGWQSALSASVSQEADGYVYGLNGGYGCAEVDGSWYPDEENYEILPVPPTEMGYLGGFFGYQEYSSEEDVVEMDTISMNGESRTFSTFADTYNWANGVSTDEANGMTCAVSAINVSVHICGQ